MPDLRPMMPPDVQRRGLCSPTVFSASIAAGHRATATVTRLRPAQREMRIGLMRTPGRWDESGVIVGDEVVVTQHERIGRSRPSQASAPVSAVAGRGKWSGTKTLTLRARDGSEERAASFTVSSPHL
ncbi:MAG: hypothetical protein N2688_04315 [Burkholderiaceae bacterium]|nr:hypothetical protein [Burkholderiaceae bacterium]